MAYCLQSGKFFMCYAVTSEHGPAVLAAAPASYNIRIRHHHRQRQRQVGPRQVALQPRHCKCETLRQKALVNYSEATHPSPSPRQAQHDPKNAPKQSLNNMHDNISNMRKHRG